MKRPWIVAVVVAAAAAWGCAPAPRHNVRVASKQFTEGVILGEILTQLLRARGVDATHVARLGGTTLVFDALRRGEIDVYVDYTGTLRNEIYAGKGATDDAQLASLLQRDGLLMSRSLGFSNNYALAVRRETAEQLELTTIDDLARRPTLRLGFSNEFLDRGDGWKNLRTHYDLTNFNAVGMQHEIAYQQLARGIIDVTDAYTTDAKLSELDLVTLEDNRRYFPQYEAVVLSRAGLAGRMTAAAEAISELEGKLATADVIRLNAAVQSGEASESKAAAGWLQSTLGVNAAASDDSVAVQIAHRTREHLSLVLQSLIPAIFTAIPLGVVAAKRPRLGQVILGAVGIVQTIPALALLVLLIPLVAWAGLATLGAGSATAVIALFLYSLLPIVRNTAAGLVNIPLEYHESATALGLSPRFRLWHIELPLAAPSILAGIKTAAVLNVGFATLGALVGARGYGQPILTGITLSDMGLIMQGAIPAACLAILLQLGFEVLERYALPAGLRPATRARTS